MQFRVIVVTDPPTHKHTHRQDRLQYTAPQLARSVNRVLGIIIKLLLLLLTGYVLTISGDKEV